MKSIVFTYLVLWIPRNVVVDSLEDFEPLRDCKGYVAVFHFIFHLGDCRVKRKQLARQGHGLKMNAPANKPSTNAKIAIIATTTLLMGCLACSGLSLAAISTTFCIMTLSILRL